MRKKDKYKYLYPIYNEMSQKEFSKACKKIRKGLKGIKSEKIIEGIGYSQIKIYDFEGRKIGVFNDDCIEAVYVCSDIEISHILGVESIY